MNTQANDDAIDEIVATCNGDIRGALKALMLVNEQLETELEQLHAAFQFRRLSVYALLQGVMGREVWNEGRHWAHLDYLSADVDQRGQTVELAKPIGYYWRAPFPDNVGIGGFYDVLGPNNYTVETTSYAKLRELSASYNVGPVSGVGNWTVSLIGRNLFTITNYLGFDPEVGSAGGLASTASVNAVDQFGFPNLRTFTFALSTSF